MRPDQVGPPARSGGSTARTLRPSAWHRPARPCTPVRHGAVWLSRHPGALPQASARWAMAARRHPTTFTGLPCRRALMPLAPVALLAPIIPALGAPDLWSLDRLALDARSTRGQLAPRCHTGAFTQGLYYLGPRPVVAPLRTIVLNRALGQHIRRQHVPWTPAPVQRQKGVEDLPHVGPPRGPDLAGGIRGATIAHCSSVRSEGYILRQRSA
jgi:hypothetical protein